MAGVSEGAILVTFTPPVLIGAPGTSVSFSGTLQNLSTVTEFINGDNFSFPLMPGALDDSPFLNNAPLALNAMQTSGLFQFFIINIPIGQASGIYPGTFTVLGNGDSNSQNVVGTGAFGLTVAPASTVPEPGTASLLAAGLFFFLRKFRSAIL